MIDLSYDLPMGGTVVDLYRIEQYLDQLEKKGKCPTCQASLKQYWHKLTPGLVKTLVKVYVKVSEGQRNIFGMNDLDLNHSEYGNFQKLRFHALIAKYKVNAEWQKRTWLITKRGGQFLQGKLEVPAKVKTFRNRVVDHSEELVNLREVMKSYPHFEVKFDYDLASSQDGLYEKEH